MEKVLKNVGNRIRPDIKVIKDADDIVEKINFLLKKHSINATCVKGGSIAKGTFLKDDYDIDLFIRFNSEYKKKNISDISDEILAKLCNGLKVKLERVHGSRDYFQFALSRKNKILMFEIIPVILVHSQNYRDAENITDLSPEHVNWVKKYTDKKPELAENIRLAKQFCKANNVYGAESYINGFSGHIVDIIVIHYGSFYNMIKAFSKFDEDAINKHIIIDTEKNLKNPLKQLNKSKITPLIIVDPIQKDRNSAAALSRKRLLMFIDAAKRFLENPDEKFFEIKAFDIDEEITIALKRNSIKKDKVQIVRLEIQTSEGSKDVAGTKALKAYASILEQLKLEDFKILASDWNFSSSEGQADAYIIIDGNITKDVILEGPPTKSREDCKRFLDKHSAMKHKIMYKDMRIYAIAPRKFISAKMFIEELSKKDFISRRVKKIFVR